MKVTSLYIFILLFVLEVPDFTSRSLRVRSRVTVIWNIVGTGKLR